MKNIWVMTIFPHYFDSFLERGVTGRFIHQSEQLNINIVDICHFCQGHQRVDDTPYGGGPGMVMRADSLATAFSDGIVDPGEYGADWKKKLTVIYTSPRGEVWNDQTCRRFSNEFLQSSDKDLVFICGRYEGIDERFLENYVDHIYSVGDFVLSGGELAVMAILDSSLRFYPGVLGNEVSSLEDSFSDGLLECSQFTRPAEFEGKKVPSVLTSGNHKAIKVFRQSGQVDMTKNCRPDLWREYLEKEKK